MADTRISVVIPAYNAADTLGRAVESVLAQGVPAQVIVVDDGSADDTVAVAEALRDRCPSLLVISQSNGGAASARNAGIRFAAAPYLCFLDADDEYNPGYFTNVAATLDSHPEFAAITTGMEFANLDRPVHPLQYERILASSPTNTMMRREVAELLFGFPQDKAFRGRAGSEDTYFKIALVNNFTVAAVAEKFYRYNIEPGNHLHYFLDRTRVENGVLVFSERTAEEASGSMGDAAGAYLGEVRLRLATAFACKGNLDQRLTQALEAADMFAASRAEGAEDDEAACFALYYLARLGPSFGMIAAIADGAGATCAALARGSAAAARETVTDAAPWPEVIRLVVVDADLPLPGLLSALGPALQNLRPTGLLAIRTRPQRQGTPALCETLQRSGQWRRMAACRGLQVFTRV